MAHEIDMTTGRAAFAFSGEKAWHGLGNKLEANASIETWKTEAGMDWEAQKAPIQFMLPDNTVKTYPDRSTIYRSDTQAPLGIVSNEFKIVQPGEVLEFFRDLVAIHGMQLSAAGCLFEGRRFWATAQVGDNFKTNRQDEIKGYLLLTTAVDGTLATTAKFTSVRTVCNNTLQIAMNDHSKNFVRVTHRREWDPTQAKIDMDLLDAGWATFKENMNELYEKPFKNSEVREFISSILAKPGVDPEKQGWGLTRKIDNIAALYNTGAGAELCKGTAFGVLQAFTNYYTHGGEKTRKGASEQFWNSNFGEAAKMKNKAFEALMAL